MGSSILILNQPGVFLVDADGNVATLDDGATIANHEALIIAGKDGTVARFMAVDATGKLAIQNPPNLDAALSTLATETKLEAVRALLQTIDADTSSIAAEDFATETTLATLATETKLEAVRVLLASLDAKDYATQTTLAQILVDTGQIETLLTTIDADTSNLDVALSTRATEATVDAVRDNIGEATASPAANTVQDRLKGIKDFLDVEDFASETTLAAAKIVLDTIDTVLDTIYTRLADRSQLTQLTDGTNDVAILDDGGVKHLAAGKNNKVDANNSSVAQLGSGGTFVGTATDVSMYTSVATTIHSDQDSAVDGMVFEFSIDGVNWDDKYRFNMDASSSTTRRFQFPVCAQYYRLNYTNGTTTTTEFRAQTILHRENILTSIHRVENVVRTDRSALLGKNAIIAQRDGALDDHFYPVKADIAGNLKVTTTGANISSDPTAFVLEFLLNSGSENMRVDGSVTPVVFSAGPTTTDEVWSVREVLLTFTADDFYFDGSSFGPNAALTNGILMEVVRDGTPIEIINIQQNEDFIRIPGRLPLVNNTGPKDILGSAVVFDGLVLTEPTTDYIRITIRDDLTGVKLKYLTASMFATRVT